MLYKGCEKKEVSDQMRKLENRAAYESHDSTGESTLSLKNFALLLLIVMAISFAYTSIQSFSTIDRAVEYERLTD